MNTIIVTGSAGLVGSECVRYFAAREFRVVGIDNDMRSRLFGADASVSHQADLLRLQHRNYEHLDGDFRNIWRLIDGPYAESVRAIVHCAGQPSHDWAAHDPIADFSINASGTLELLEFARQRLPHAAFIFTSTNKVYGDRPNEWKLFEDESRFEPYPLREADQSDCCLEFGINESLSIDACIHSLFGASKLAADILVQEYGRYFGMNTVAFRCGCITGAAHAGAKQHGFLSYLVRCAMTDTPYEIIGYKGKQVRDNIHAADLVAALDCYLKKPTPGAVYNMGGGRANSCSVREAIALVERISGKKLRTSYTDTPRVGDHQWWITDVRKFQRDYPGWNVTRNLEQIIIEIVESYR